MAQGWSEREMPSWSGKGMRLMAALLTQKVERSKWGIGAGPARNSKAPVGIVTTSGVSATDEVTQGCVTVTRIQETSPSGATRLAPDTADQLLTPRWGAVLSPEKGRKRLDT